MRGIIIILILAMIGTIGYLVIGRNVASSEQTTAKELVPGIPGDQNKKKSRTPHLVLTLIDPTKHLDEQIEAIRALPSDLTNEEFLSLVDLLYQSCPEALDEHTWPTLQNEIMEVLRQSRFNLPDYAKEMARLLSDRNADPVMRDYAAQHLALYVVNRGEELSPPKLKRTMESLVTILEGERERGHQVVGTTLMALCSISEQVPEFVTAHKSRISAAVISLLDDSLSATLSNRVSAIQAAGRMKISEAHPLIRAFATDAKGNSTYRLNAIAALGYYGDHADRSFLESLASSKSRFRFAAQTALKNF